MKFCMMNLIAESINSMVITVTLHHCSIKFSAALTSLYLNHFLTDGPEILHDDPLSGKDQVYGQNSYPAALQYYMQR